jgi:uncharacterized protein
MNLLVILLTGLTVGGLTCLAVQGGLLASVIAAREGEVKTDKKKHALYAIGAFLLSKLLAYTALGFVLGAFGGALTISDTMQTFMQLVAGLYMIAVALNLLQIHPLFRYVIIQPPRSLARLVRNQSRSKDIFAPALLGAMTIFIPCGTTLAMETLAISSANPFLGASILGTFILGTMPLFFGIGLVTSLFGEAFQRTSLKLAAVAVIYLGITAVNGAFIAFGFPINSQNIQSMFQSNDSAKNDGTYASEVPVSQNAEILVTAGGYSPSYIKVKQGSPVTLKLTSKNAYSCASAFRIPSLRISKNLGANETQSITFTPTSAGKILFSCSMGMFTGVIEVL